MVLRSRAGGPDLERVVGENRRNGFLARAGRRPVSTPNASEGGPAAFWALASVIGLCGFGMTTMLAGMAIASNGPHWGVANGAVFPMALAFGGGAQFLAGIIMLRRGEIFPGSAFVSYAAFWWAFTMLVNPRLSAFFGPAGAYGIMWFMIVWAMFTFSFALNAPKHGPAVAFVFWSLLLAFVLLAIDFGLGGAGKTVSSGLWEVSGIVTFICGASAWYAATGILTAAHHGGRKILPY